LFGKAQRTPTATLGNALGDLTTPPASEVARLRAWLAEEPAWSSMALGRLDIRLDLIRRLSFDPPSDLIS
jgi:hypothetical protein